MQPCSGEPALALGTARADGGQLPSHQTPPRELHHSGKPEISKQSPTGKSAWISGLLPEANTCPPRVWKSPARHLVSLFSEKHPGCGTTVLLVGFTYSQLPTSSSWSPPPLCTVPAGTGGCAAHQAPALSALDPPVDSLFPSPIPAPCPHAETRCLVLPRLAGVCLTTSARISAP